MLRSSLSLAVGLCVAGVALAEPSARPSTHVAAAGTAGKIAVANRNEGTVSIIDVSTDTVLTTFPLPSPGGVTPEPMYIVYAPRHDRFYVGDRANDQIVAYDPDTFAELDTVPTDAGVFHMWADPRGRQMWVVCDVDDTCTVIDLDNFTVLTSVPIPPDLLAGGGSPHDVVMDPNGKFAYVSIFNVGGGSDDVVVKFSTTTFQEVDRVASGLVPHLAITGSDSNLYLTSQNTNEVKVLDRTTLAPVTDIPVTGAHGVAIGRRDLKMYVSNTPGDGSIGLWTVSLRTLVTVGSPVDTPTSGPHNLAVTGDLSKLYCTHSSAAGTTVSVWDIGPGPATPAFVTEVSTGLNPYGITFVP